MALVPFRKLCDQALAGGALPWGVLDGAGNLLVAKGTACTAEMLEVLSKRQAFVEVEGEAPQQGGGETPDFTEARPGDCADFFDRWEAARSRLFVLLRDPTAMGFVERTEELAASVSELADRFTDPLLFSIIRHDYSNYASYGVAHSLHCAALCSLLGQRLGLPRGQRQSLTAAALTANVAMVDLQGQLAAQKEPLTPEQKVQVREHPQRGVDMLRAAGVTDEPWLLAVLHHHETPQGTGYPGGIKDPCALSQVLRIVDVFLAKHAGRVERQPVPARKAAQDLYLANKDQPAAAVLIKELGVYLPGCFVKLASGEIAVVLHRPRQQTAPGVAVLINRQGESVLMPMPRDTSKPGFAVVETVPDEQVRVRMSAETLYRRRDG